jgi:CheY-like chemotaxis protein
MSRILLADDSPHAQRMGERILLDEGYEVVTVTDGDTALIRLADADPDVLLVDAFLPSKSGYQICEYVKAHPRHKHTRVVLLAGQLEDLDEQEAQRVKADGVLRKPFEASAVVATLAPLIEAAQADRGDRPEGVSSEPAPPSEGPLPKAADIDPEQIRAAVTLALDAAMPAMIDEITERVLVALGQ